MDTAADLLLLLPDVEDSRLAVLQFLHRGGDSTETLGVFVHITICRLCQKRIELFAQLCDRSVDISKAHALTGNRRQFLLHRIYKLICQNLAP